MLLCLCHQKEGRKAGVQTGAICTGAHASRESGHKLIGVLSKEDFGRRARTKLIGSWTQGATVCLWSGGLQSDATEPCVKQGW